ncbi:exo-alpha-sialidase [Trinickia violacea]|uniref:Exo-alpha-sialidase n=1 Tax=Trinickia violacea TaxID=2571746 RepID=A0A4V1EHK8_9BURK|nr:sialidase family protein [Trinickia violacea]QCP50620.1 exo-alpha-sialidase [Trinickia violacea]
MVALKQFVVAVLACVSIAAFAQQGGNAVIGAGASGARASHATHRGGMEMSGAHASAHASSQAAKAPLATGAAFDARHRLWAAWVEGQHILVAHSDDKGRTLSAPVVVNAMPEPIYTSSENRPKVAASPDARTIYVTWSMPLDAPYTGMVRFSRSTDGGATWSVPVTVHGDRQPITHRFDVLIVDPKGRVFVAWIDKRDLVAATKAGRGYDGAAVYYAVSSDGGQTFAPERKVADQTCECCQIALAIDGEGRVEALWRNVFTGQIRDHALAVLLADASEPVTPIRATFSNWHVEACPHQGPALAITPDGVRHMVWFGVVDDKANVYYSRLDRDGKPLDKPRPIGSGADADEAPNAMASHATLIAEGGKLWLAWKSFEDDTMRLMVRRSDDGGVHWSAPKVLAQTAEGSDNPQLLADDGHVYVSWRTQDDGYRLLPVEEAK